MLMHSPPLLLTSFPFLLASFTCILCIRGKCDFSVWLLASSFIVTLNHQLADLMMILACCTRPACFPLHLLKLAQLLNDTW